MRNASRSLRQTLTLSLMLGLAGCGPASSDRTKAGARPSGNTSRAGTSSVTFVRDSSCAGRTIVNTRFDRVSLRGPKYAIVQSVVDASSRDCAEGESGTVSVLVWPDEPGGTSLTNFTRPGTRGALVIPDALFAADSFARLYRTTQTGCCGALDADTYTNLETGKAVFAATSPLLFFDANGTIRYLSILTQAPAGPVDSTRWGRPTAAVIQYGTGADTAQWVRVPGDTSISYAVASTELVAAGKPAPANELLVVGSRCCPKPDSAAVSGVQLLVTLVPMGDGEAIRVTAHVDADRLSLGEVRRTKAP